MKGRDFIPGGDNAFLEFAATFVAASFSQKAELGIPETVVAALKSRLEAFQEAHQAAARPSSSGVDFVAKDEARLALEREIRQVKNTYIDPRDDLGDALRGRFGLAPRDRVRTEARLPDITVRLGLQPKGIREILVERTVAETGGRATPYNMAGALLFEKVGGEAPRALEELSFVMLLKRLKTVLTYGEGDRGKPVWYAARWVNSKGAGPWGVIEKGFVP